jgi:hypothetical protein
VYVEGGSAPIEKDVPVPTITTELSAELDRQARVWAGHGHPVPPSALETLRAELRTMDTPAAGPSSERVPFLLVVPAGTRPAVDAMARVSMRERPGTVNRHAGDIDEFAPIPATGVPGGPAYLLVEVERGSEFCGVPPESAVATLADRGRTPLTVAEGIALITLHPEVLEKNRCFSLAGSRHGDRRVPALWISKRAPHLGWCFAGVPHDWLGVASVGRRVG